MENYLDHSHSHVEWTDDQLSIEAATCELLLDKWQTSPERRQQLATRALLTREELIARYAERHQGNHNNTEIIRRSL